MRAKPILLSWLLGALFFSGASALTDPYAWLEEVRGPKPLAWVADQNRKSLGTLKADSRYPKNYDSILSVLDATDRIPMGGLDHGFVYNFWQDAKNPKGVWRRTPAADYQQANPKWEILLDVDALAKSEKENWVFEGAECSPGQTRCLIRLSRGGGDAVVVREYDLRTRNFDKDGFALPEAKADAAYDDDDTVLFATAADGATKSGYARVVKRWNRGTPVNKAGLVYEGSKDDVLVSPTVFHTRDGNITVIVQAISFFENDYFLPGGDVTLWRLPVPRSAVLQGVLSKNLIFTLREAWVSPDGKTLARGSLIAVAMAGPKPGTLGPVHLLYAPGPRASVESVGVGRDKVYAAITTNVIGAVHVFAPNGKEWSDKVLPLPANGSADIISTNDYGPEAMFSFQNYLTPTTLYFDGGKDAPQPIKSLPARFDAGGMVTEQFEALSKDGTKIPYFVTRPKNLKGPAPTVLYGYGGFEVSLTPAYSANFGRLWLSHGGIYVVANIRGGGEFGPAWHDAALKTHRQRAYDDFAAVAIDLEKRGLTTPKQLGIMGGSNGGLLVSTVMTQIPDRLGAVVCQVPLIDMIAYTHIGAGASWVGEYGDPADPKMRDYILTYSPYQNVKPGVKYPPVFFVTATSDDRVTPVHARKMAAKMEAQGHDVLFYENTDGGHAAAADHKQAAEMWALSFVYLAQKLGLNPWTGDDDLPTPIDFHDLAQARAWEADTIAKRPWRRQFFAAFAAQLHEDFSKPVTILELGSGPGHLAEHILGRCSVSHYTALDFSAAMHAIARERLQSWLDRITFVERDFRAPDWNMGMGTFDAVVTLQAAHETRHKRHLPALFARTRPLLKPHGVFLYCDHYSQAGSGKNPDLYLDREAQPQCLQAAGFTNIRALLDLGGMALYSADGISS